MWLFYAQYRPFELRSSFSPRATDPAVSRESETQSHLKQKTKPKQSEETWTDRKTGNDRQTGNGLMEFLFYSHIFIHGL